MLGRLYDRYGADRVLADQDLFEDGKDWNKRWKAVYEEAGRLYILVRGDGTVGLGLWKQTRWLVKRVVPSVAVLERTPEIEHGEFDLRRLGREREDGGEDHARFARVRMNIEEGKKGASGTVGKTRPDAPEESEAEVA